MTQVAEPPPTSLVDAAPIEVPEAPLSHRQILTIFSGLMLCILMASLDQTIVATALPTITGELGGLDHLSWVVTAYMLAATVSTPLYGKLGDVLGRKKLLQVAVAFFLFGSALCGVASSMNQLIAFRAIQGVGAGGLLVLALAIIGEVVSPRERGRYQGYFGAVFGASSIAGPLLGGFFTDHASWRWVFLVNLPVGLAAMAVIAAFLPAGTGVKQPKIDYAGAVLLTAAVTLVVLITTWGGNEHAWGSPTILTMAVAAFVLLAVLGVVERRSPDPMVPLHLFRTRTFGVAVGVLFLVGMAMFGAMSFLPLFLQVVTGSSATSSGILMLPLVVGLLATSVGSGQAISRTGHYKVFPMLGCACIAVALVLFSTMGASTAQATASAYMFVFGAGLGFSMQTLILAVQNAVDLDEIGVATSSVSFFRSLGGSVGVAVFGAIFNSSLNDSLGGRLPTGESGNFTPEAIRQLAGEERVHFVAAFADSLTDVFLYAVPLGVVAWLLTLLLREVPLRTSVHSEASSAVI